MAKHTLKIKDIIETVRPEAKTHKIEILKRSGDILVVNKPSGMVTNGSSRSLEVRLQHELNNPQLCAVHRLDRDTSGCVMFAANAAAKT
jgi:23S rRNA-/tRNA-specific pseudouridylate synthase